MELDDGTVTKGVVCLENIEGAKFGEKGYLLGDCCAWVKDIVPIPITQKILCKNKWEINEIGYWDDIEYRVKQEPKYRPFKDAKECWAEMLKHQPFGWVKSQIGEVNSLIILIDNEGLVIGDRNNGVIGFVTATDLFKIKFADGTPFGVKVEG